MMSSFIGLKEPVRGMMIFQSTVVKSEDRRRDGGRVDEERLLGRLGHWGRVGSIA